MKVNAVNKDDWKSMKIIEKLINIIDSLLLWLNRNNAFTNKIIDGISPIEYKLPCHQGINEIIKIFATVINRIPTLWTLKK